MKADGSKSEREIPITLIEPSRGLRLIDLRELRSYRDLFFFLVWRDVKVLYKQTVLGFAWAVIRPFLTMIVFTIVFGRMANISSDGIPHPIFYYSGLLPWTYFSTAMTGSTGSLIQNASMLTKVYFPRLIVPMTPVLSGLVDFALASVVLGIMMAVYGIAPPGAIVFLPILIMIMIATAAGVGMWLSAMTIQYRDVKHAISFLSQILMYAAPVVWPVSLISEKFPESVEVIRLVYGLYPMAGVIEGFRAALLGTRDMPWDLVAVGALSAALLVVSGAVYFRQMERRFADVA